MTACHYAARNGHLTVVKLLVGHGANRQLKNEVNYKFVNGASKL